MSCFLFHTKGVNLKNVQVTQVRHIGEDWELSIGKGKVAHEPQLTKMAKPLDPEMRVFLLP